MQKENLYIRQLGLDDYEELLALWRRSGLHSLKPRGRDSRASLARQLASGVQVILGLEADGQLIGAVVTTHDSRKGWINRLVIDPHSRRQGHAARLITAAEETLHEQGMHVIAVLIEGDNSASLALFQKAGYVEIEPPIRYLSKRESDDV